MDLPSLVAIRREPTPSDLVPVIVEILEVSGPRRRSEIVDELDKRWRSAGGRELTTSILSKAKKALSQMQADGLATPLGTYGVWGLPHDLAVDGSPSVAVHTSCESSALTDEEETGGEVDQYVGAAPADTIGFGPQTVYCIYLPLYRCVAAERGDSRWPIKIGMTTGSVSDRLAQLKTGLPEQFEILLLVRTGNAALLERTIHSVLSYRGRRVDAAGGSEWFETNDDELRAIVAFIEDA